VRRRARAGAAGEVATDRYAGATDDPNNQEDEMIFAVTRSSGTAWARSRSLREQEGWTEHAALMDALAEDGFVLLAGPLRGRDVHRALIVVEADSEADVHARLAADPWTSMDVLTTTRSSRGRF
jgi:uncharacterized protein YciI